MQVPGEPSAGAASRLFAALAARPIRFAVYKNAAHIAEGLAGTRDLDLWVAPEDAHAFAATIRAHGGIRAYASRFHDNAIPSRSDWLLPLESGAILHLDVASPVMVGRKFCKPYRLSLTGGPRDGEVPTVSAEDAARIALARMAFAARTDLPRTGLPRTTIRCSGETAAILAELLPRDANKAIWHWREGQESAACVFLREGATLGIEARSLAAIRRALRRANGAPAFAPLRDLVVHSARRTANALFMRLARMTRSTVRGRRRLATGTIIALIGPDGVGKSTQSAALAQHFGQKVASRAVYMGSNDGSWMRVRRKLALGRRRDRNRTEPSGSSSGPRQRGWLHAHGSALWRLIIAFQRRRALHSAQKLARGGAIAIADRWPQTIAFGLMDGPSQPPPRAFALAHALWRIERRLYAGIEGARPDLTIHLDCDFATSNRRKPGDISAEAFAARIALMERMRADDPAIVTIDARRSQAEVFADLCRAAWEHLAAIERGQNAASYAPQTDPAA